MTDPAFDWNEPKVQQLEALMRYARATADFHHSACAALRTYADELKSQLTRPGSPMETVRAALSLAENGARRAATAETDASQHADSIGAQLRELIAAHKKSLLVRSEAAR